MKRIYLLIFSTMMLLSVTAQEEITSKYYEWKTVKATDEDGSSYTDALQGTLRVSDNGKWAVGCAATAWPYPAYVVEVETAEMTFLTENNGDQSTRLLLNDVSNDGHIVGAYINSDGKWTPGVVTIDGEWTELPQPEKADQAYRSYDQIPEYCCVAVRISSDGTVVLGKVWVTSDTAYYDDGTSFSYPFWEPCLWKYNSETGGWDLTEFYGLAYRGQGFMPWDMSDDGTIIAGMAETERGDQCPGFITDGKLQYIAAPTLALEDGYTNSWVEVGNEDGAWWKEGIAPWVDDEGNIYFRYEDGYAEYHGGKYNVYTEEKTMFDQWHVSSGIPGFVLGEEVSTYGPAIIIEGDQSLAEDVAQLAAPTSLSDDGRVIAGGGITASGVVANYPAMLVFSASPVGIEDETEDGIAAVSANNTEITRNGDVITATGCDKLEIVNAAGQTVAASNSAVSLEGLAKGVYVVRATKGGASTSCKVLK